MHREILFGICADVHHSTVRDEKWRVEKFIAEANDRKADFVIQLGDLTNFSNAGLEVAQLFQNFNGPCYHVLGNHETERSNKRSILDMLGQKDNYFSFDVGDYHFVVLDTNYDKVGNEYIDYDSRRGDNCYISAAQLQWLEADLAATEKRCFLFTHATCEVGDWRIVNLHDFLNVIWRTNQRARYNKVTMVFSGHDHADEYRFKGGIHYLIVNSMSHKYIDPACCKLSSHAEQTKVSYGELKHMIPYKDPLYAFVRLKPNGLIQIMGKQSEYVGNSPMELHWAHYASPQIQ